MAIEYTKSNEKHLKKIYVDANDQYIGNVEVYGDAETGKLYIDEEKTTELTAAVASDLFVKGILLVNVNTAYFKPVAFTGTAVITIGIAESAVAATTWTVE